MQWRAGAQAAAHCWQLPSLDRAHCLYVRSAGSNMQASGGVHGAPKWKHAPAPPDRHVKYAPAPAWNAQLGAGQPTDGSAAEAPAAGSPLADALAAPGPPGVAGAEAERPGAPDDPDDEDAPDAPGDEPAGDRGRRSAGPPHPRTSAAAIAITRRTARL